MALPAGRTPLSLYEELTRRVRAGAVSFKTVRILNLDEYSGLTQADPRSFAALLRRHLIQPAGIKETQLRLLQGNAADAEAECRDYERTIITWGGIDLCILGLGANGHIAFNEPGSDWSLGTRAVELSVTTHAARQPPEHGVSPAPAHGLTMGIATLLASRNILLLIGGAGKQAARNALYRGVPDRDWPVTSLLDHPKLTVIDHCETQPRY